MTNKNLNPTQPGQPHGLPARGSGPTRPVMHGFSQPASASPGQAVKIGKPAAGGAPPAMQPPPSGKQKWSRRGCLWLAVGLVLMAAMLAAGAFAGYLSGEAKRQQTIAGQTASGLKEQYELGLEDMAAGRYEVARQRFDYILSQDPMYPGASDQLTQAIQILYATATPTPVTPSPTITPTPTHDPRPAQDLFAQAQAALKNQDWGKLIDTLTTLRQKDAGFQVAQVDRMLYIALRNWGVYKILHRDLEGGIYDLALAERIGPLDKDAVIYRDVARMYMYGLSFWEAMPEKAVYYFGQAAAALPSLTDASGWTASRRYSAALAQYASALAASGDWCEAQKQFEAINDQARAEEAALKCSPPTATFTLTPTPTLTGTAVPPSATGVPATTAAPVVPTATPTQPATSVPPTSEPPTSVPPSATPEPPSATPPEPSPTIPPATEPPTAEPPTNTPEPPTATVPAAVVTETQAPTVEPTQPPATVVETNIARSAGQK